MRILASKPSATFFLSATLVLAIIGSACQQPATDANSNVANSNITSISNVNTNTTPTPSGSTIQTSEPDNYSAKITLKLETIGSANKVATPPVTVDFARNGADRRYAFTLPVTNERVIYIDRADKRYIIMPNRKQYAELTPEATGFEIPSVMTPGQIIGQIKNMSGCERVSEDNVTTNNRPAIKYRCASTANTGTQAGQVTTESFIFIDKETNLPLHSETLSQSSGNVEGVKGIKLVTEMSDIQTTVDPTLFDAPPAGMNKVQPEQVRQQVNLVMSAITAIVSQVLQNSGAQSSNSNTSTTTTTTTTMSPTPTMSATPSPTR